MIRDLAVPTLRCHFIVDPFVAGCLASIEPARRGQDQRACTYCKDSAGTIHELADLFEEHRIV